MKGWDELKNAFFAAVHADAAGRARQISELFYISADNQLMSVAITAHGNQLDVGEPRPLFAIRPRPPVRLDAYPYDVLPDGRRFVVNTLLDDTSSSAVTIVLNWTAGTPR